MAKRKSLAVALQEQVTALQIENAALLARIETARIKIEYLADELDNRNAEIERILAREESIRDQSRKETEEYKAKYQRLQKLVAKG